MISQCSDGSNQLEQCIIGYSKCGQKCFIYTTSGCVQDTFNLLKILKITKFCGLGTMSIFHFNKLLWTKNPVGYAVNQDSVSILQEE